MHHSPDFIESDGRLLPHNGWINLDNVLWQDEFLSRKNKKRDDKITKLPLIGIGNKIWYAV